MQPIGKRPSQRRTERSRNNIWGGRTDNGRSVFAPQFTVFFLFLLRLRWYHSVEKTVEEGEGTTTATATREQQCRILHTSLLRPLSYGGRGEMVLRAPHHSKNFFDCLAASGREASVRTFFSCNNERTSDRRACRASYFYDLPLPLFRRFFFYTAQREFFLFHSNKVGVFPPLFPPLALPRAPVGKVLHALSGGRSEAEAEATGQGKAAWSEEGGTGTEREGGRGLLSLSLSLSLLTGPARKKDRLRRWFSTGGRK